MRLLEGDAGKAGTLARDEHRAKSRRSIPMLDADAIADELELVREACKPFDLDAFREGHLTPVFFGSALKNFGVGDLLDALGRMAPPPRAQKADKRTVEADEPSMSAFVFKIQANMDPNHRDRIAFARLCSGKLTRGMKVKQVRTGKPMTLQRAAVLLRAGPRARRRGLCRRRGRHPQPRHAAHRRHADRGRGHRISSACRTSRRKSCAACGCPTR